MNKDYFASMNTSNGFCSYFSEIFSPEVLDGIYIIKGGSGTGKSTIMKKIGTEFEKNGYQIERFYCSSDTSSLDGVIIDGRVAVIDGTAPHTTDPKYPGAVDEIINLSQCWNIEKIKNSKKEIIRLTGEKSSYYRKGYSFLSAAGKIKREMQSIVCESFKSDKMLQAITRFLRQNNYKGEGVEKSVRLVSCIGPDGRVHLNTFENASDKICLITNAHCCEGLFFKSFITAAEQCSLKYIVSYDPICPENVNGLYFPEIKMCVTEAMGDEDVYDDKYKVFNLERFIDKDVLVENRSKLRFANKCYRSLISGACDSFADAKVCHGQTEQIYTSCVNFEKVSIVTQELMNKISNILKQ